jgi:glucose-1-phosphatase
VPARKLRAILFDIGRVLVGIDVSRAVSGLASGATLSPKEIWSAIENDPRWPDWQEGRISARDWHLHLTRRLGINLAFEQFTEIWNRALQIQPLQDNGLLESLSGRYRLGLLSNTDPIHVAYMEANFSFFRYFPVRIYSCAVGASKPNPRVYQEALRGLKVQAAETVYIDDLLPYVDAARSLGLAGVHYRSPDALVGDLRSLGVNVPFPK